MKPNDYRVEDWQWLLEKIEKRIKNWTFRLLSICGKITLIKEFLISISIYQFSILQVPSSVINQMRIFIFNFPWTSVTKKCILVMDSWERLFLPIEWGGWGIKKLHWFSAALRLNSFWRGLTGNSLQTSILHGKYLKRNLYD